MSAAPTGTATLARLSRSELLAEVCGALAARTGVEGELRIGVEVEAIPIRLRDGRRLPIEPDLSGPSGVRLVHEAGRLAGWPVTPTASGKPGAEVPGVGRFTFEPGGQIELSSLPMRSVDVLASTVQDAMRTVHAAAAATGVGLVHRGMDPSGDPPGELFVDTPRYRRQRAHYDRIGPWGARMMCQSAAIHVNVDLGAEPVRRWWVANRMAPAMIALFANAPGAVDGRAVRSVRAEQWRRLDPGRTGVIDGGEDPASAYFDFALAAADFLYGPETEAAAPFRRSWEAGADLAAWRAHLTTLFPEVRPRGYLELRSFDALRPAWYPVPLVLVVGLLYDATALAEAESLLLPATHEALVTAGRDGLADARTRAQAEALFDLGIAGAARLGPAVVGEGSIEVARAFRERFLARGVDPGGEHHDGDPFEV